ncbi:pdgfa associated protein 1b isoform X2 [Sebastes fasciatus]|uniref:pdgfa associated protein 1b isoform X2 n=1 Tax=Sebastes fasciatus TaxID=394691 RepID=UPI003D9DB840
MTRRRRSHRHQDQKTATTKTQMYRHTVSVIRLLCYQTHIHKRRRAGVEGLIEIENPNRAAQKSKKVTQIELDEPKQLSRREREEIEKQKAKERYMKMHLAGKTDQAKADLARLAIIKKQREDAAKKKEAEKKAKDAAATAARGINSLSMK